ncbi:MAG TPA: hypothetical protein VKV38_14225 [Trebonia sp.]|jgi:nitrous oxide reductase|nr:hypothetical protein [Trebonia sp.]
MTSSQVTQPSPQLNMRQIVSGSILMGIGGALALAGAAMAATALVAAYRERLQRMEVPPGVLARQNWERFKAASAAGMGEWRNGRQRVQPPAR